jgi:hypothetical protein
VSDRAPRWFPAVAIIILLWSLMGVASFVAHWLMGPTDIAALPAIQQDMMNQMTGRTWVAFPVATGAGLLGAIALLAKRRAAIWLFVLSLIAILIQFSSPHLVDIAANRDASIMAFPAFIAAMALLQAALAWRWSKIGLLK